jgi:hypothetical protein
MPYTNPFARERMATPKLSLTCGAVALFAAAWLVLECTIPWSQSTQR